MPKHDFWRGTVRCSFRNGRFWSEARPHKGFRRRRSRATSRTEARGERRIGPKYAISEWTLTKLIELPIYSRDESRVRTHPKVLVGRFIDQFILDGLVKSPN